MLKRLLLVPLVLMFAVSLSACNTMAGAGKDIQKGGEKVEDSAQKNKNY